jgi:hypothetical protein
VKKRYYVGADYNQFKKLVLFLRNHRIDYISASRNLNQTEYTLLIGLKEEDLLFIKLGVEIKWIREAKW